MITSPHSLPSPSHTERKLARGSLDVSDIEGARPKEMRERKKLYNAIDYTEVNGKKKAMIMKSHVNITKGVKIESSNNRSKILDKPCNRNNEKNFKSLGAIKENEEILIVEQNMLLKPPHRNHKPLIQSLIEQSEKRVKLSSSLQNIKREQILHEDEELQEDSENIRLCLSKKNLYLKLKGVIDKLQRRAIEITKEQIAKAKNKSNNMKSKLLKRAELCKSKEEKRTINQDIKIDTTIKRFKDSQDKCERPITKRKPLREITTSDNIQSNEAGIMHKTCKNNCNNRLTAISEEVDNSQNKNIYDKKIKKHQKKKDELKIDIDDKQERVLYDFIICEKLPTNYYLKKIKRYSKPQDKAQCLENGIKKPIQKKDININRTVNKYFKEIFNPNILLKVNGKNSPHTSNKPLINK